MKFTFGTAVVNNCKLMQQWIDFYSQFGDCYVVEGATVKWKQALGWSGHNSNDGTVEIIRQSGVPHTIASRPWVDEDEQCNEFMSHVSNDTDFLWCADSDEFYMPEDIEWMRSYLTANPHTTFASFDMYHWWKNSDYYCTGGSGWAYDIPIPRLWRYHLGAKFSSHFPPTIKRNGFDLSKISPLLAEDNPVVCRHYSYCFRQQVLEKLKYYSVLFNRDYMKWFHEVWEKWTPETRNRIESRLSVHPSRPGATTVHAPEILHPIEVPWE